MIINAICVGSGNKFECVVRSKCKYTTCVVWRVGNCQWNSQKIFASKLQGKDLFENEVLELGKKAMNGNAVNIEEAFKP